MKAQKVLRIRRKKKKKMNKIIIPTGYMGSGSSAITNLISEFEGYEAEQGTYEYVFLHCPNGVFDLEDKLLMGNNAVRSDEAIHEFLQTMKQLYNKKYWWVGHYEQIVGKEFWKYTQEYADVLVQFEPEFYWYYQENADKKMIVQLVVRRVLKLLSLGKVNLKKPLLYRDMKLSYVMPTEFFEATRNYLEKIWILLGANKNNVILDQLLLPFNLHRFEHYFDERAIVFVVERDPRDVFITNKYIWPKRGEAVPYPTEVKAFCECYRKLRKMEKPACNENIHRIKFEDLIYNYEESVTRILSILKIEKRQHELPKSKFIPEKSINNTQLFLDKRYIGEAQIIEKELSEYIYKFPFERESNQELVF